VLFWGQMSSQPCPMLRHSNGDGQLPVAVRSLGYNRSVMAGICPHEPVGREIGF
jgi:hypothetical protein